jgi:acetylornithine deacetylase
VRAGEQLGDLAARAEALVAELDAELRERAPEAGVELEPLASYPPLVAEPGSRAAGEVAALAESAAGGAVDFGTEAGLYRAALGVPVLVCGPGDMAQAHVADEYLERAQLAHAERFVGRIAAWLSRGCSAAA